MVEDGSAVVWLWLDGGSLVVWWWLSDGPGWLDGSLTVVQR
jgi:hypothetical protein